jgi:5-methylcytosine-specific restriction enzyme A
MPRAPSKCARFGCETRTTKRYCRDHAIGWQTPGASRTATAEHKAWRLAVLNRCAWRCQTRGPGCEHRASQADHIIPVAEGGQTTMENGAGICVTCHKIKSQREAAEGRRRAGV